MEAVQRSPQPESQYTPLPEVVVPEQAIELIEALRQLTPAAAEQIVNTIEHGFPLARLELTPRDLSSLTARCREVYGQTCADIFAKICLMAKQTTESLIDPQTAQIVETKMLEAARIILDTIPKDPVDLEEQGQNKKPHTGSLCDQNGLIATIIVAGVNHTAIAADQLLNTMISPLDGEQRNEIQDAVTNVLRIKSYMEKHQSPDLILETDISIPHAYTTHRDMLLTNAQITTIFRLLPSETAVTALFVNALVPLNLAIEEKIFHQYAGSLSKCIENNLNELIEIDNYQEVTARLHELASSLPFHKDLFFSAFLKARTAMWWIAPLCREIPFFTSIQHELQNKAFEIIDIDKYLATLEQQQQSLCWHDIADIAKPDNAKLLIPRAIALLFGQALGLCSIPGIAGTRLVSSRPKSIFSAVRKATPDPQRIERPQARPPFLHKHYKMLTPEEMENYAYDGIGISIMIDLEPGATLEETFPFVNEIISQLGLLSMREKVQPLKPYYQTIKLDLAIPNNSSIPAFGFECRISPYSPYAPLEGGQHIIWRRTAEEGVDPDTLLTQALSIIAIALRLTPRERAGLGEQHNAKFTAWLGVTPIPNIDIQPEADIVNFCLRGWTVADVLFSTLQKSNPQTARQEIIRLLRLPIYISMGEHNQGGHICTRNELLEPPSNFPGNHIQTISSISHYISILNKRRNKTSPSRKLAATILLASKITEILQQLGTSGIHPKSYEDLLNNLKTQTDLAPGNMLLEMEKVVEQNNPGRKLQHLAFVTARRNTILEEPLTREEVAFLLVAASRVNTEIKNTIIQYISEQILSDQITLATVRQAESQIPPQAIYFEPTSRVLKQIEINLSISPSSN